MTNPFQSSDSVRTGRPLAHAQTVTLPEPLELELGGVLPRVDVTYEVYGRLSKAADNAVLICHALSGDSHVARHEEDDDPGWWDVVVGPGGYIDTDRYFVICPNILGGCRGTTGPNSYKPGSGRRYGADFPTITIGDMVEVHRRLLRLLGIEKLLAVVGGSMGGHQALCWATRYPDELRGVLSIATSPRVSSQGLAFDIVGRNAILRDPNFRNGQYYDRGPGPDVGLALARMIGHITYLSREAMQEKFEADRTRPRDVPIEFEKRFSVGSYLGYQGAKFVERFDANSYITLSVAMDMFDLGMTREQLSEAFRDSRARWLIVSFSSDWLFSPAESRQLVDALVAVDKPVSYCNVTSSCGHDAFLLPDDAPIHGELIRAFLANLNGGHRHIAEPPGPKSRPSPTSIFHSQRLDYESIRALIPRGASVLDLGCGDGELLAALKRRDGAFVMGVEIDEQAVVASVRRGLDVIHADLNLGLPEFRDGQFDYVVLSRTLQAVRDVRRVLGEMLRVGRRCVVTFPNFGFHRLRTMLVEKGRAPESGSLPHKWYDTPNIRFFTIADFEDLCAEEGVTVHRRLTLDTERGVEVNNDPNLNADLAIFVVSREADSAP